jgi:hypothetical protein
MKSVSRRDVLRWMASAVPVSVVASQMGNDVLHAATAHPRLLFTSDNIPAIRAKLTAHYGSSSSYADVRGSFQSAINDADSNYGTISSVPNARYYAAVYAFLSQILPCPGFTSTHTPAQHGNEAGRLLQIWVDSGDVGGSLAGGWPEGLLGYAYDWAYPYLGSSLKSGIVTLMKQTSATADSQYNNPWAAGSSTDISVSMMFASAVANDGVDDAWASAELAKFSTRVSSLTGVVGSESAVAQAGPTTYGCGLQSGLNYMNYQWPPWVQHLEAYRTANGISKASFYTSSFDAVVSGLYWLVYSLRPDAVSNASYPNGFRWSLITPQYSTLYQTPASPALVLPCVFAGIYNAVNPTAARLAMWLTRQRIQQISYPASSIYLGQVWLHRFACEDPTISEASPSSLGLPLSATFGDGRYEFKSGWDPDGSTNTNWAIRFHATRYETLNDGREPGMLVGHYEIHRKGPQTIMRGSGGHIPIWPGALNRLYFLDTTFVPPFTETGSNGFAVRMAGRSWVGQNPYASNRGNGITPGSPADYYTETRSRFASGNVDLDYLFADLTKWWPSAAKFTDGNNPAMVTLYHDQKVLFRPTNVADPVLVVVFVRYGTTSTNYQPIYCWNPAGPSISVDGVETRNSPVRWSGGHGNWTYTGASRAICVNTSSGAGTPAYNGKNILTVIRPTSRTIIKSGGPDENGNHFQDSDPPAPGAWADISKTWSCEAMDYYGQRYPMVMGPTQTDETIHHGEYFIQVQPSPIVMNGDFCLVNEVGDAGITPASCDHVTGSNFAGVAIRASYGNRIAVFGTAGDAASGSFVIPTAGTYKALICNVLALSCAISGGSNISSITAVEGGSGSPFAVPSSRTVYVNIVVSASGTGAANTITLQGSGVPSPAAPAPPTAVRIIR